MAEIVVSENTVKKWVSDTLTHFGVFHWSVAAGPISVAGLSDKMAVGPDGVFMAFEIKGGVFRKKTGWKSKAATPAQMKFLERVAEEGGKAFLVGPREAATLGHALIAQFPSHFDTLQNHQHADRAWNRRMDHLRRIVERGF